MKNAGILLLMMVMSTSALATINNTTVSLNGSSSGPFTFAPSESITVTITADVNNDGAAPIGWVSTAADIIGESSICSEDPTPDVTPAFTATEPGTVTIAGLTVPSTPGTYQLLPVLYGAATCSNAAGLLGISATTFTVADAPPTPATPVPTLPVYGLVLTMLGLLVVAGRRLRASAKRR